MLGVEWSPLVDLLLPVPSGPPVERHSSVTKMALSHTHRHRHKHFFHFIIINQYKPTNTNEPHEIKCLPTHAVDDVAQRPFYVRGIEVRGSLSNTVVDMWQTR